MKKRWKRIAALALAFGLTGALAGCGGEKQQEAGNSAEQAEGNEALKDVTVILDYVPNTNHTGMYVALEKGYYEAEGLNVKIIEPTDGATATLVAQGKGTFGVSYQEDVTIARSSEDPLPVKAIATLIQHNTSGFVSLADSGITSPKDFEGKTYAGWAGPGEAPVLEAVMTKAGADFDKLNIVISDGSGFEALGKSCDVMWFFEGWDSVMAEMNGVKLNYMPCRELDERLDYYTPVLIAGEQVLKEDPEMVKAFLRATKKGYEDTIADPDGAAEILQKAAPNYDLEMLKKSQEYLAGKFVDDAPRWGVMKEEVWQNYTDFMTEYGVIEKGLDVSGCYTNDYLPE